MKQMDERLWQASLLGSAANGDRGGADVSARRRRARRALGQHVREWRIRAGVTSQQAAEMFEVPAWRLYALELGDVPWTPQLLATVADRLGTTPDALAAVAVSGAFGDLTGEQMLARADSFDEATRRVMRARFRRGSPSMP